MNLKLNFHRAFWIDYYLLKRLLRGCGLLIAVFILFKSIFIQKNYSVKNMFRQNASRLFSNTNFYIFILIAVALIVALIYIVLFFKRLFFIKSFERHARIIKARVNTKTQNMSFLTKSASYTVEVFYAIDEKEYTENLKLIICQDTDAIESGTTVELAVHDTYPEKPLIADLYFQ